jgi:hypothetical protein
MSESSSSSSSSSSVSSELDSSVKSTDSFCEPSAEPVSISIQEEGQLYEYTNNHFNTQIYNDLDKLRNLPVDDLDTQLRNYYIRSNSPVTVSNGNSRHNSSHSSLEDPGASLSKDNLENNVVRRLKRKQSSCYDIEKTLDKYYDTDLQSTFSNELDILTTYVKGQKHLYTQSTHFMHWRLHCLMVPALVFSATITILAPFIECKYWSGGLISALNAVVALFISLINYLKLESSVEIYLQLANHYDKLETSLEMTNSKLIFLENPEEKRLCVLRKIRELEKKIIDMKESTTLLLPEEIKLLFPVICHINIFLFIKKMEINKKQLLYAFRDMKREIQYLLRSAKDNDTSEKNKTRLLYLYETKTKIKHDIMDYRSAYSCMDDIFSKEINLAETRKYAWCCPWGVTTDITQYFGNNKILNAYLQSLFHTKTN